MSADSCLHMLVHDAKSPGGDDKGDAGAAAAAGMEYVGGMYGVAGGA